MHGVSWNETVYKVINTEVALLQNFHFQIQFVEQDDIFVLNQGAVFIYFP